MEGSAMARLRKWCRQMKKELHPFPEDLYNSEDSESSDEDNCDNVDDKVKKQDEAKVDDKDMSVEIHQGEDIGEVKENQETCGDEEKREIADNGFSEKDEKTSEERNAIVETFDEEVEQTTEEKKDILKEKINEEVEKTTEEMKVITDEKVEETTTIVEGVKAIVDGRNTILDKEFMEENERHRLKEDPVHYEMECREKQLQAFDLMLSTDSSFASRRERFEVYKKLVLKYEKLSDVNASSERLTRALYTAISRDVYCVQEKNKELLQKQMELEGALKQKAKELRIQASHIRFLETIIGIKRAPEQESPWVGPSIQAYLSCTYGDDYRRMREEEDRERRRREEEFEAFTRQMLAGKERIVTSDDYKRMIPEHDRQMKLRDERLMSLEPFTHPIVPREEQITMSDDYRRLRAEQYRERRRRDEELMAATKRMVAGEGWRTRFDDCMEMRAEQYREWRRKEEEWEAAAKQIVAREEQKRLAAKEQTNNAEVKQLLVEEINEDFDPTIRKTKRVALKRMD